MVRNRSEPVGNGAGDGLWVSLRWPLAALVVSGLLLATAFALDTGGERARDAALIIGAPTLYVLLPASLLWLLVVIALHARRSLRPPSGTADGTGRGR